MITIKTVDALCGSGKTYAAINFAVKHARRGAKFVFVQPAKELNNQSYKDCLKAAGGDIPVTKIHTDTCHKASVKSAVLDHVKQSGDGGEILFITHAAFLTMRYWHNPNDWHIIFDEIPVVDKCFTRNVPNSHKMVTDLITSVSADPLYYQLIVEDSKALRAMAENKRQDDVYKVFRDVSEALISDHWGVFTKKDNWHRLTGNNSSGSSQFVCFGLLKPSIFEKFKSVTIMGAMLKESIMYLWWLSQGVQFISHPVIEEKAQTRLSKHLNGSQVTIRYFFDAPWSKYSRDTPEYINGGAVKKLDHIKTKMKEQFGNKKFLWVANNDVLDSEMNNFPNAQRLSNSPHGLNQYQGIHNVIFLSALNPTPAHFVFLESKGISSDDLRDAMVHQTTYQSVMRCSVRNTNNSSPKTVLVTDKQTAEWLGSHFAGCSIAKIDNPLRITKKVQGRPKIGKKALSGAEKTKRCRDKKKKEMRCNESTLYTGSLVTSKGSIFSSIYSSQGETITADLNSDQFINELRDCHFRLFENKEANALYSSAVFDPDKSDETDRGINNITHLWGIWLDNDGGDLSWREFQRMFPDLRMVCMNTWTGKDRYRVFIPTSHPMTVETHQRVIHHIINRLNGYYDDKTADIFSKKGRKVKRHGFDMSKLVPSSLFYMPCQPQNPKDLFFKDFSGNLLDPIEWADAAIMMVRDPATKRPVLEYENDNSESIEFGNTKLDALRKKAIQATNDMKQAGADKAIQAYKNTPSGQKLRHSAFFTLGLTLKSIGFNDVEISEKLKFADTDGSRQRKNAVSNIMKSLKTGKYG